MKTILSLACICLLVTATAQQNYSIEVPPAKPTPIESLPLSGTNNKGDSINVNNEYIIFNGKPFYPIMGEFHFSRYPNAYWEESILKMKAGGINVIATYVFWNLHERTEGNFDWTGDRNLKKFISLCNKHKIFTIIRVGPYGHGEIRNGAIPDWLYGMPVDIRSDNNAYLNYVKRYYSEIGRQLNGLLFKDGGYVIGTQLENEYQHAGSTWTLNYPGAPVDYSFPFSQQSLTKANTWNLQYKEQYKPSGDQHMQTLKNIAIEAGLQTPLYTATGWGYAAIVENGSLPVSAAYAYPSWGELEASPFYLFKDLKRQPDYGPVRYNGDKYPCISAEMGSGIMIVYNKRPKVPANSIAPMMVRAIGSGSNGIGYYMYHGGSTPVQDGKFMSEELSGLPKISYDFQAPIGEYGQVRDSYKDLVPLHLFLKHYGSGLATYRVTLPLTNPTNPTSVDSLRYAVRSNGKSGFVFVNNYQDHADMQEQHFSLAVKCAGASYRFSNIKLAKDQWAIFPFNMSLSDQLQLVSGTALPVGSYKVNGISVHLFMQYNGIDPLLTIEHHGKIYRVNGNKSFGNQEVRIISEVMAKKIKMNRKEIIFSTADLIFDENKTSAITSNAIDTLWRLPLLKAEIIKPVVNQPAITVERPDSTHVVITMKPGAMDGLDDVFVRIPYTGDFGQAFLDGELVADQFYFGDAWEIGLKRFAEKMQSGKPLYLYFHPMRKDAPYLKYLDKVPAFNDQDQYLQVKNIEIVPQYKLALDK